MCEARVIMLCLPTTADVDKTVTALIDAGLTPGCVIVDSTSGEPTASVEIARRLAECGCFYVDAPVSGGPRGAEGGTLTVMAGGEEKALQVARPYLEAFAKKVVIAGPCGSGHALKAMNNTLNVGHLILGTEALLTLRHFGVHPDIALDAINASSGRSLQTEVRLPNEVLTRRFAYGFDLGLMRKDVNIGRGLLMERFPRSTLIQHVAPVVDQACEAQGFHADYTEVARYLEGRAGTELVAQ